MQTDAIFPATWFVLSYLALLIALVAAAAWWARTHGQMDDPEEIRWKVFNDGVPNPATGSGRDPQDESRPAR